MALRKGRIIGQFLIPVGIGAVVLAQAVLDILARREQLGVLADGLERELARIVGRHAALLGAFGRNEDHTAGGTRTVDRTRRSILQHVDRLDVLLVDRPHVTARDAVDNHERALAGIDRRDAAQLEIIAAVGAGAARDGKSRNLALERRGDGRTSHAGRQVIALDRGDGRSHRLLFHRTVTDHHDVLEYLAVVFHDDVDDRTRPDIHGLLGIADEREFQLAVCRGIDRVTSVDARGRTRRRADHHYGGTDQRLAGRVGHLAAHLIAALRL